MRATILAAIVLLCACTASPEPGVPASGVSLHVEPDAASPGGTVELTLRNESPDSVGYNLCTSGLERRADGAWQAVPSDRVCTMELRTLAPGADARYSIELPEELAPGDYRFHTTVWVMATDERLDVRSDTFRVDG